MESQETKKLGAIMIGAGLITLMLHFYYYCYAVFEQKKLTHVILNRFVENLAKNGVFRHPIKTKLLAIAFLAIAATLDAYEAANSPRQFKAKRTLVLLAIALAFYFGEDFLLTASGSVQTLGITYITVTTLGLGLIWMVMNNIISLFTIKLAGDVFNKRNETFPQEERKLTNPFSINLKARYRFRNQLRRSWINVINPFRGTAIYGSPGAGKSHYIVRQFISQSLKKGFTMFVYDFKFDDLTRLTYNNFLRYQDRFPVKPAFYVIDFDHLCYSSRCNPIEPSSMTDVSDATESSRTILLALNRDWIHRQGDFFIESAVSFVAACMWFLRKYEDGRYCTLPHLIEFIQMDYTRLFSVLRSVPEIETMIGPFLTLYLNGTMETLDSQAASARIALSMLASPRIYYVLSGNEFTLDINNPDAPKVVCMGSNAQKQQLYGAVLSLYITRMIKLVNRKGQHPCHILLDEVSTTYIHGLSNLMATARSNGVAVTFTAQSDSLLRDAYGRLHADVLFSLPGNIFCGQANSDTARAISECIGKNVQTKLSVSENSRDSSYSQSEHLDAAVPPSTITGLSAGEFVGYVADDPDQRISTKAFHCEIQSDNDAIRREESRYVDLPIVREEPTQEDLEENFARIKLEVAMMVSDRLEVMRQSPLLANKIIIKPDGGQLRNNKKNLDS